MNTNDGNIGYAVLGFFVPVAGLVLYLIWKDEKPGDAKMAGIGALISFVIQIVFSVIAVILMLFLPFMGILYH